ncbi:MAG: GntR family transcriptional regulator [Solirubrobacteraceae bacterium]
MVAASTDWGLGTVQRRSTTDQVLHELRTAILAGRIKPREPLPEAALAQTFGTGRSAIREALRQLVQEGLVVSELNRGAWVRALETADVIDVYRARTAIEVAAVRAATERDRELDLTGLDAAQARILIACGSNGSEAPSRELIAADIDFHRDLVMLAGSPRLSRAHEPLAAESQMLLNWHPVYSVSDYASEHQTLLDALRAADPGAAEAVRAHLMLTVELILQEAERYASRLASAERLVGTDSHNEGSSA